MAKLPNGWDAGGARVLPDDDFTRFLSDECGYSGANKGSVTLDGRIHRFATADDRGQERSGWYVAWEDEHPAGVAGDWRSGVQKIWIYGGGATCSPEEAERHKERVRAASEKARGEREKGYEQIAGAVSAIIREAAPADDAHPYLIRKKVRSHGLFQTGDGRLIMPVYINGRVRSAQYISADGTKQFHCGGEISGGYFILGAFPPEGTLYLAEGYATAASVYEATGKTTMVCLNAGNLPKIARQARDILGPQQDITVVADNDASGTGQRAASECAAAAGAKVIIPPVLGDANDYACAGHDLAALLEGQRSWLIQADEFCREPAPIRWLVKRWIQREGLSMVFGDSGAGKTFVTLDWALRIASSVDTWEDEKIRHGGVVYLAGEGHHGLKARIAGWKQYFGVTGPLNMWVSSSECDLNAPEGISMAVSEIENTGCTDIAMIVVDTLHRFLVGDENKAVDAKTMLDACAILSRTFKCAVVLVHHIGVNPDAKSRARGSSSWRGALDNQILVETIAGGTIKVSQVKNKDSEMADPVFLEKIPVTVKGWYDEDGKPVSTVVLERADAAPMQDGAATALTKAQQEGLQAYREAIEKSGVIIDGEPAVAETKWREAFYSRNPGREQKSLKGSFYQIKTKLFAEGTLRTLRVLKKDYVVMSEDFELEKAQIKKTIEQRAENE